MGVIEKAGKGGGLSSPGHFYLLPPLTKRLEQAVVLQINEKATMFGVPPIL